MCWFTIMASECNRIMHVTGGIKLLNDRVTEFVLSKLFSLLMPSRCSE